MSKENKIIKFFSASLMLMVFNNTNVNANIDNSSIERYTAAMYQAANNKDINKLSGLISDKLIISVNRNGVVGTMGKRAYLDKLQDNWMTTSNYKYNIEVNDVVIMGKNAKAKITTTETFRKKGQQVKQVTEAKATLTDSGNKTVLLKAVSEVTIK